MQAVQNGASWEGLQEAECGELQLLRGQRHFGEVMETLVTHLIKGRRGGAHHIRSAVSRGGLEILKHTIGLPGKMKFFLDTVILKL